MRISRNAAGNVLALDLATTFGFALGPLGRRPLYGAKTLQRTEHVHRCADLRQWIEDQEQVHGKFTALVVEAAIIGNFSSQDAERLTIALHTTVELWAYDVEIPFAAIAASTVRKSMIGRGTFPKGQAKPAVMQWCRAAGLEPRNDDAADAILLWKAVEAATIGRQPAASMAGTG